MYFSKSFCNVTEWMSNVVGQDNPIGEISPYSMSFSKEVGIYTDPTVAGFTLLNFKSATDGIGGVDMPMSAPLVNATIGLINNLVNNVTAQTGEVYVDVLLQDLVEYGSANGISQISLGAIKLFDEVWCPEYVKFKFDAMTVNGQVVTNENTIWLENAAFENQYDEYEIVVVPPLDNLDGFFANGTQVLATIAAINSSQIIDRILLFSDKHPYTIARSDEYTYVNPINSNITAKVNWPVIIYGPAGNNIDAIKDALIAYILSHTSQTRADWTKIFPDIFKRTEFIIAPMWHKYAIENRTQAAGVYSSSMSLRELEEYVRFIADEYTIAHVDTHACVTSHPYRSILLVSVGGPDNRNLKYKITEMFPDYVDVSSTSPDFNRMSPQTVNWVLLISDMILRAETMTKYTSLPVGLGITKMERAGMLYAVATYQGVQYLVATKKSVYEKLGLPYA